MPKTEAKCANCGEWFQSKVLSFGNDAALKRAVVYGNREPCAHCGAMTLVEKRTLRVSE